MKKILAILCGGLSEEAYLSRRSGELICSELNTGTYELFILDWQQDGTVIESQCNKPTLTARTHKSILHCFADFTGDGVINLLHAETENCGQIQGLLELADIPCTGNGLTPSVIGMDKILTKHCFRDLGIPTPGELHFQTGGKESFEAIITKLESTSLHYPLMAKPVKGGSSIGIHHIPDKDALMQCLGTLPEVPYFLEQFISGADYGVGVFATHSHPDPVILPIARIDFQGTFFDASIKYDDTYRVTFPTDTSPKLAAAMRKAALEVHQFIGFNGFSRCDFIVRDDDFFGLEVNTHPGMSSYSIIPNMVQHAGLSLGSFFTQMIDDLLNESRG